MGWYIRGLDVNKRQEIDSVVFHQVIDGLTVLNQLVATLFDILEDPVEMHAFA